MAEVKQFIFFDFEMLCSNRGMAFEEMEAIRLGAAKYNLETGEIELFDRFIRPNYSKPLSAFCKKLTGITDEDLVDADDFKIVMEEFLFWIGGVKKSRFFSWSTSDLLRLKIDANAHQIAPSTIQKIEKRYVDFQGIFTKRVSRTQHSVENALNLYGLSFVGDKHNPMYDAYNTLRIYLAFENQPLTSELNMLNKFIFEAENVTDFKDINAKVKDAFNQDLKAFIVDLKDIIKMKDAQRLIKRTNRLVQKYENILINRANLYRVETKKDIRLLVDFYQELLVAYEEHESSNILILHEQMVQPLQELIS